MKAQEHRQAQNAATGWGSRIYWLLDHQGARQANEDQRSRIQSATNQTRSAWESLRKEEAIHAIKELGQISWKDTGAGIPRSIADVIRRTFCSLANATLFLYDRKRCTLAL
jgi:hypothetical protein